MSASPTIVAGALAGSLVTVDPDPAHIVGTGGAIGALLRYWVGRQVSRRVPSSQFPLSTVVVNVVGSFVLGLVVLTGAGESTLQLVGTGICGSFTTFSSFSVETVRLYERGDRARAIANAAGNLTCSLVAIGFAWAFVAATPL